MDVPAPQRQHPVVNLDCGWDRDDQRGGGKEETEIRIHAADIHVVCPHDEAEATDREDRPDHHPVTEDVPARVRTEQIGHYSEGWQRDDVYLRMAEEPEQVLK